MIKRLLRLLILLALAVCCAWMLLVGMPALEKMTPSKTSIASTATIFPAPMLATAPEPSQTASMIPTSIPTNASIEKAVVAVTWAIEVHAGPDPGSGDHPVAWLYTGAEVVVDECQHGWAHLVGGPGWVRSDLLEPDVCGGE